ncbi:MAG: MBL fold metallo-hydrolase, partial [bacterium]
MGFNSTVRALHAEILISLFCFVGYAAGGDAMEMKDIRLTVLYDNVQPALEGLVAEWGFSCLVEAGGHRLLFDTGGSEVVRENMRKLGVDPASVEAVVLSHAHGDHFG